LYFGIIFYLFKKSYETLEFLGDSFLGSAVTNYLYNRYVKEHNKEEGFLTKLKIRFVCGEQLANLSNKLELNKFMIISKHIEDNCSGRENQHILEDVLEAFIGALYLDCEDYQVIQEFIFNLIEEYLDLPEIILNDTNYKDQILRYFQHNFKLYPTYQHIDKLEDEEEFKCEILKEDEVICIGSGKTKKKAEQNASYNALVYFNVLS
jgi:ribonuclease-3